MVDYTPENLRAQFPQLEGVQNLTLFPILEVAVDGWLERTLGSVASDVEKLPETGGRFISNDSYHCVVEGKIGRVCVSGGDIDVEDDDESWYMACRVSFGGNEAASGKLFESFRSHIAEQGLEELTHMARTKLRKGKTYHLSSETSKFYFGKDSV